MPVTPTAMSSSPATARAAAAGIGSLRCIWRGSPSIAARAAEARPRASVDAADGWSPTSPSFLPATPSAEARAISTFSSSQAAIPASSIACRSIPSVFIRIKPSFGAPS